MEKGRKSNVAKCMFKAKAHLRCVVVSNSASRPTKYGQVKSCRILVLPCSYRVFSVNLPIGGSTRRYRRQKSLPTPRFNTISNNISITRNLRFYKSIILLSACDLPEKKQVELSNVKMISLAGAVDKM